MIKNQEVVGAFSAKKNFPEKIIFDEILISDCPYVNIAPLCPTLAPASLCLSTVGIEPTTFGILALWNTRTDLTA
jgi:Na+-translocating ferredoxin:NAD+ oxidoreductase RnfE subunit